MTRQNVVKNVVLWPLCYDRMWNGSSSNKRGCVVDRRTIFLHGLA